MKIKIDLMFWFEMIRFIIVGIVIVALATNLTFFSEVFENIEPKVTGTLLGVLFILFALKSFQPPHFKTKKEIHNE